MHQLSPRVANLMEMYMKAVKLYKEIQAVGQGGMLVRKTGDNYKSCLKLQKEGKIEIIPGILASTVIVVAKEIS